MSIFTKHWYRLLVAFGWAALLLPACQKFPSSEEIIITNVQEYDSKVIRDWNDVFLEVERYAAGYRPGPAPRSLAYLGLSAYEACIAGMPDYNNMTFLYKGLTLPTIQPEVGYHWPTVVNASYGYLMPRFFPNASNQMKARMTGIRQYYEKQGSEAVPADVYERSKRWGEAVAAAVWAYSKTDVVGHDHYLDPFQGYDWQVRYQKDGDWKPTLPGPGKAMGGVWGKARTFAVKDADKLARPPLPYSTSPTSPIYAQALEVYSLTSPKLSVENHWVAEFWSDDIVGLTFSPGPRWLAIGNQVLAAQKSNLATALEMNIKLGLALNDASVSCWHSKYYYNVERPVTYINRLIDPKWKPILRNPITGDEGVTPSFPAYPSGHSTMGAAGAEVLGGIFGYNYTMTDRCHEDRTEFDGRPRTFSSFLEMAQENAWSRLPLGVHYRMDSEEGVRMGIIVGRRVNELDWKKK